MACIVQTDGGWLVDNEKLLNKYYQCVRSVVFSGRTSSARSSWSLMSPPRPQTPYFPTSSEAKTHGKRKCRKYANQQANPECDEKYLMLLRLYKELVVTDKSVSYFKIQSQSIGTLRHTAPCDGLSDLCELSKLAIPAETTYVMDLLSVRSQSELLGLDIFNNLIMNGADDPLLLTAYGASYLIPAHCQFLMSDIAYLQPLIDMKPSSGYNLIVVDPPWDNGSVRRSKRYSWLQYHDLMKLPVEALAACHALVVMWTTNHPKYIEFVKNILFPHWSIDYICEWHWMKVTTQGELVIPIDSVHRKPYEPIIIGRFNSSAGESSEIVAKKAKTDKPDIVTQVDDAQLPRHKVICSIPTSIHSQKPILSDVMHQYLPENAKCLELFARNLLPGWTSWGNEVLKFQNSDLYWKENK